MSSTVSLKYNAIIDGKWITAGDPIERSMVPPALRKYIGPGKSGKVSEAHLPNTTYYVDQNNRVTGRRVAREIAQMEFENELNEQEANQPLSKAVADAVAHAQEDYAADIEGQKLSAKIAADRQDELYNSLEEEKQEQAESGEFDEMDEPPKPKSKVGRRLFVERKGRFVPASTVKLIKGETLYWHRRRELGVSERYIKHSIY